MTVVGPRRAKERRQVGDDRHDVTVAHHFGQRIVVDTCQPQLQTVRFLEVAPPRLVLGHADDDAHDLSVEEVPHDQAVG